MTALRWETGVVNNPVIARFVRGVRAQRRHDPFEYALHDSLVGPLCLGFEVMKRLMPRARVQWINVRSHWLNALSSQWQHKV